MREYRIGRENGEGQRLAQRRLLPMAVINIDCINQGVQCSIYCTRYK